MPWPACTSGSFDRASSTLRAWLPLFRRCGRGPIAVALGSGGASRALARRVGRLRRDAQFPGRSHRRPRSAVQRQHGDGPRRRDVGHQRQHADLDLHLFGPFLRADRRAFPWARLLYWRDVGRERPDSSRNARQFGQSVQRQDHHRRHSGPGPEDRPLVFQSSLDENSRPEKFAGPSFGNDGRRQGGARGADRRAGERKRMLGRRSDRG